MNIDDLKIAWKEYDRKLESTLAINERIILSMITERSGNRFTKVKRQYLIGMAWMFVCLGFSVLVLATNPFDYNYSFQYMPMGIFGAGLAILLTGMIRTYTTFQKISVTHLNVDQSLKRIIAVYEKPKKFFHYTIIVFLFSQVVLFPLSFLPQNIERMGWGPALLERLAPIAIGALLLFMAFKLGVFKETRADQFRDDLDELQMLKKILAELEISK